MRLHIRSLPPTPANLHRVGAPRVVIRHRPLRVLDVDIENRPLSYLGSDFTTAEVTTIAWAWVDKPEDVTVHLLGDLELPELLQLFVLAYDRADLVTGHFITGHDLPMIQGALMEFGLPGLSDKLVQDTKTDLMRAKGLSRSQESLSAMFDLAHPKVQMNQHRWRQANRLTPEGLAYVRERVTGDVRQHIELRERLLRAGYLGPPRVWKSKSAEPLAAYSA